MQVRRDGVTETDTTVGYRFGGGKTTVATTVSASGDTVLHTPATGKKITLYWVAMSSSQNNAAEVQATIRLGTSGGPYTVSPYSWNMGNPGAFSHWEKVDGANVNDALIVTLSAGGNPVIVNYSYTEA